MALQAGFVEIAFVGCEEQLREREELQPFASRVSYVEASTPDDAAGKAVALAREGAVDILMKGLINTDNLLRAVLNKETGILPQGNILTHIAVAAIPAYHKLLAFTDGLAYTAAYRGRSSKPCQTAPRAYGDGSRQAKAVS